MTATAGRRPFTPPASVLIPWEGKYKLKGKIIKIIFDLQPGETVDPKETYTVYRLIGTDGCEEFQVSGQNIINPERTGTYLKGGY